MGDGLEYGYKDKTADTEEEHGLALYFCQMILHTYILLEIFYLHLAIEAMREYVSRNEH